MRAQPSDYTTGERICWKNGELVKGSQAYVSIYDHGLLYGDGCFEGLRFYHKKPFRLHRHLKRLRLSLQVLDIEIPYTDGDLIDAVMACISRSGMKEGYLRILVTRGEGDMGLNPENFISPNVFIIPASLSLVSDNIRDRGARLITSSIKRATGTGLDTRVKSLNYLHSVLARAEANASGADEAILLNQFGYVAECSAENLFIAKDGVLLSPAVQDGALEGITREAILELAAQGNMEYRTQSLTSYDLYTADECFLSGSGARLFPVLSINGRPPLCPGPAFRYLLQAYQTLIDSECLGSRA